MHNPLVSVLIPTYNSAGTIEALLCSIAEQSYEFIETIVVDNNSPDQTLEIAHRYTKNIYTKGPERSAQRNYAAKISKGELLIVLDSDMVLTRDVVSEVVKAFEADQKLVALIIPEESFGIGFWASCKKLERSFYIGVEWMEAARAFRRIPFVEIGGYDELNTGTEDYDLPHRLEEKYGKAAISRISSRILHNEGRLEFIKTCKKKYYYARALDVYRNKEYNSNYFSRQSNPLQRFSLYFKSPMLLFNNPVIGIGMLFMKVCEMSAGFMGFVMRRRESGLRNNIYR